MAPEANLPASAPPRINILTMLRLGLYQMALGMMAVLTLAVINRLLISEFDVPGTLAATAIAIPQLLASPGKVWFGQLSDARPLFGLHRSGYVWLGAICYGALIFGAIQIVWHIGAATRAAGGWDWSGAMTGWMVALGVTFALYGTAVNASSTPFATLLVDVTEEDERSRVISVAWSFLMVGIVVAGVGGSKFLEGIQTEGGAAAIAEWQDPINLLFGSVPVLVVVLALLATVGIEAKYSRFRLRSRLQESEEALGLGQALRVLTASRQTGFFFTFLIVMTLGLFMQEAVLEPYGGDVFGMSIAATTQLNAFWGVGILLGLSASGFLLASRIGKRNTTRLGCLLVAASFVLVIFSGFTQAENVLRGTVFLFGLAAGVTTNGALSLMLDLTAAETAGTFIGAWGLAQALARGVATASGGIVLDLGQALFASPVLAYGLVFGLQAVLMVAALFLLDRVDVTEFRQSTGKAILAAMESDLDG